VDIGVLFLSGFTATSAGMSNPIHPTDVLEFTDDDVITSSTEASIARRRRRFPRTIEE
jgi:hypothetical protein